MDKATRRVLRRGYGNGQRRKYSWFNSAPKKSKRWRTFHFYMFNKKRTREADISKIISKGQQATKKKTLYFKTKVFGKKQK